MLRGRHGAFRRTEALAVGYSAGEIRARVRSGRWLQKGRGVYVTRALLAQLDRAPDRLHLVEAEAVALAARDALVLSHGTAARWHGLEHLGGLGPQVHATRLPRVRRSPHVLAPVNIHAAALPRDHLQRQGDVWVTTVPRTVADIARDFSLGDAVVVGNSALSNGRMRRDDLHRVIRSMTRWPGVRRARVVADLLDARVDGPIESLALAVWHRGVLPPPQCQVRVYDEAGLIGIVDGAWPEQGTVYETDGMLKYREYGDDILAAEKRRQERLEQAGLQVRRFSWRELWEAPVQSARRVRVAFELAARLPRPRVRMEVVDRDAPSRIVTLPMKGAFRVVYDGLGTPLSWAKCG